MIMDHFTNTQTADQNCGAQINIFGLVIQFDDINFFGIDIGFVFAQLYVDFGAAPRWVRVRQVTPFVLQHHIFFLHGFDVLIGICHTGCIADGHGIGNNRPQNGC